MMNRSAALAAACLALTPQAAWGWIPQTASISRIQPGLRRAVILRADKPWKDIDDIVGDEGGEGGEGGESPKYVPTDEEIEASIKPWDKNVPMLNTVHLVGRVGNEPNLRELSSGDVVVNLSLAVTRKYHPKQYTSGEIKSGEEGTDWFGLEMWGSQAKFAQKFVDKGARVGVIGSLKIDKWTDRQTGKPRIAAKIVVREFDILETKAEAEMRRQRRGQYQGGGGAGQYQDRGGGGGQYQKQNSGKYSEEDDDDEDDDEFVFGAKDSGGGFFD